MQRPPPSDRGDRAFRLGGWHVVPDLDQMSLQGSVVKLEPRTMRVLLALAREPGKVVSVDALLDEVWPHLTVTSNSIYQAIGDLRRALSGDAATTVFIATVPKRGYRLVAPVSPGDEPVSAAFPGTPPLGPRSVAMLPFTTINIPASHDFLKEILLDNVIDEVSRHPAIVAIARGTMLSFAGRVVSPATVAAELGVRFVVEGRLLLVGRELRADLHVVDASRGVQILAEEASFALDDWSSGGRLAMARFARSILLELADGTARDQPGAVETRAGSAIESAMRAWVELYCRPQTLESNERAWRWAKEALALDPASAVGLNALAFCEWRAAQYGWGGGDRRELLASARQHAQRAIDLSPRHPDPYYTLALVTYLMGDIGHAEALLRHCIALNASHAPAHALLGLMRTVLGFPQEAADLCARAFALSPYEPLRAIWHWIAAWAAILLGRDEEALARAEQGIAANPHFPTSYVAGIIAAERLGRRDVAARHAAVLSRFPAFGNLAELAENFLPLRLAPNRSDYFAALAAAGLPERHEPSVTASG